jgi:hypothetical protein
MIIDVNSDKIVLESGEKNVSILSGKKEGNSILLLGNVDKNVTIDSEKDIPFLEGLKFIDDLEGLKFIDDLEGLKFIDTIFGETDKSPTLLGNASEGFWFIFADTTYFFADDTIITADRD